MQNKPRLHVKSLADAMKQLRAALDSLATEKEAVRVLEDKCRARGAEREEALRDAKTAHAEHDDLKKRLLDSEIECSRLRGYMQRVAEDDAVADPLVEVDDQNGKRMVSKRYPSVQTGASYPMNGAFENEYDGYGNKRPKPKHWVTY